MFDLQRFFFFFFAKENFNGGTSKPLGRQTTIKIKGKQLASSRFTKFTLIPYLAKTISLTIFGIILLDIYIYIYSEYIYTEDTFS